MPSEARTQDVVCRWRRY